MKMKSDDIKVGGQAVIEGVMMRTPSSIATAVRVPDGRIKVRYEPYISLTKKNKLLSIPIIRGAISFFEMLVIGIKTLSWSSDVAMEELDKDEKAKAKKDRNDERQAPVDAAETNEDTGEEPKSKGMPTIYLVFTLILALGLSLLLFFFLPIAITSGLGFSKGAFLFNLVAGGFRVALFLIYLALISRMKDIRRVFEYHGAEHKSVFAFEEGKELNLENTKPYTTHHPRCGTSFILIVVLVAILLFSIVDTLAAEILGHPPDVLQRFFGHLLFLPLVGGGSYELLRLSGKYSKKNNIIQALSKPGLWLQHITTKEPDDEQLEVALTALNEALKNTEESYVRYT